MTPEERGKKEVEELLERVLSSKQTYDYDGVGMTRDEFMKLMRLNVEADLGISEKKNSDYADSSDPFQNFKGVEHWGVCTVEQGLMVRISDKMQRVSNLLKREAKVSDESIVDTLSDARNYLNILQVWIEHGKKD